MAFTVVKGGRRPPKQLARSNVRVGVWRDATNIYIPKEVTEQLGINGGTKIPLEVSVGSDEHQGLIQINTNSETPNRKPRITNGRIMVRLGRQIIDPGDGGDMRPQTTSWMISGHTLTVELPASRYVVTQSARNYLRA